MADWEGAQRLINQAIETFGRLDILILNAGILRDRMTFNMTEEEWDAVIRVHLKGHFAPVRWASSVGWSVMSNNVRLRRTCSTIDSRLRRIGARKVPTARVPIVFDQQTSRQLLGEIFDAVTGDAVYRSASFLAGKLGEQIAGKNITIVDDGTIPGGFGTSPFDGEGVPTRRTTVIENGVLKSYLLNTYTAKKLGLETTGNASRGLAGNPGVGSGNFFLQPGAKSAEQIIRDVSDGLYVTEFLGFGVNLVTGDFSRGATGLWIKNGELTFPVEEITVAGNLKDMLNNIAEIGSDLEWRSSVACPTLRIEGMTVAGE